VEISNSFLSRIYKKVKEQVEREKKQWPIESLEEAFQHIGPCKKPSFRSLFLEENGPHIISEIKYGSPSAGSIKPRFELDCVDIAGRYLKEGASALSIVTEPFYFKGDALDIKRVSKEYSNAHVLRKDFVIDEFQVLHTKVLGAKCILLIVALLGAKKLEAFLNHAKKYELEALVEVHNQEEFKIALDAGAKIIGVNNRDLKTFEVSIDTSLELASMKTKEIVLISESGISSSNEIKLLQKAGFDGFLIGSSFMREKDPSKKLKELIQATRMFNEVNL
jgi:indole-3-glycerol phosphate synthase